MTLAILLKASSSFAYPNYSPTDLQNLTDDLANSLVQTIAIGASYRPMEPATPLGAVIGLDVGVDVTVVSLPQDFKNAISTASGVNLSTIPAYIPLPRLSAHKGLPHNIDVGFGGLAYANVAALYGGDVKWAFFKNPKYGTVAIREAVGYSKLFYLSTRSYDTQLLISKNVHLVDPYGGMGYLMWNGDVEGSGIPAGIAGHRTGANPHFFGGLPVNLLGIKVTAEVDYNLAGIVSYSARVGVGF